MAYKDRYTSKMIKSSLGNIYKLERINGTWILPVTDTRYYVFKEVGERRYEVWKHQARSDGGVYEDGSKVLKTYIGKRAAIPGCLSMAEREEIGGEEAEKWKTDKRVDG